MALVSPGVEVSIIDESQYIPAATNSVPYFLIATATNKASAAGVGVAPGTLAANANKVYLVTSQRDLAATYGNPFFYNTTSGTPINGYELNEYGLLAAFSALGVSNRAYVQRVDVDLAALAASLTRPLGSANNGDYWFDTNTSQFGIFEWNQTTGNFTNKVPTVITSSSDLEGSSTVPVQTLGSIGDYAITAVSIINPGYYKRGGPTDAQTSATYLSGLYNTWVQIGSDEWATAWPTIQGSNAPTSFAGTETIVINGAIITSGWTTVSGLQTAINNADIPGVYAANVGGKLFIYADSNAQSDGSTADGAVLIANGTGTPLTTLGITSGTYYSPTYQHSYSYQNPRWGTGQTTPRPTGSVWQKMNNVNLGMNLVVKKYSSTLGVWVAQACPIFNTWNEVLYNLDPTGGGQNIPVGTTYADMDAYDNSTSSFVVLQRYATGDTVVTGDTTSPGPFAIGDAFTITATEAGTATTNTATATLTGETVADFIAAVSAANVPYVSATVNGNGAIVFTHSQGGTILVSDTSGTPIANAGFNLNVPGCIQAFTAGVASGLYFSNWATTPVFTYTASDVAPDQDPADGTYWYYSTADQVDIMVQNNGVWMGYQNVTNDIRGYDLSQTNATGPIVSASEPLTQTDANESPLVLGDLWIDTSDLENYPVIKRWESINGVKQWVVISNADQTTSNGVLFADARWGSSGDINPVSDNFPTITSLLTSDYLDLDAPDAQLYPEGILLFNTRRSGFNVKTFQVNYFNTNSFAIDQWTSSTAYSVGNYVTYNNVIYVANAAGTNHQPPNASYWTPVNTNAWVTASGLKTDGSPYMGRQAQRAIIVKALKAGIDTNTDIREEYRLFNLVACPQYPELMTNMVALSNERNNTCFVVGDTPLRLSPENVLDWATNNNGLGLATNDGLNVGSQYMGVFYPSCQTNDLSGNTVVTAPSHMMIRTIIRNDEVAYPWFAPAGTRRGVIDNALSIGYINAQTGEYNTLGVNQGLRDVLYENSVNPITFIPGVGITNFGNKTVTSVASAMDRINVARLVAYIRGRLETIGKQFLFEPNDQITRNQVKNAIDGMMIDLVAKRALYDYLVVCDLSNNTPTRIDRNELWVDIAIEPVKAVEFIYIPVRIMNTGEIAATTTV